jgi:hypothetical protein
MKFEPIRTWGLDAAISVYLVLAGGLALYINNHGLAFFHLALLGLMVVMNAENREGWKRVCGGWRDLVDTVQRVVDQRERIRQMELDTPVLVPGHDHSYRRVNLVEGTAIFDTTSRTYEEDYGQDLEPGQERVRVYIAE